MDAAIGGPLTPWVKRILWSSALFVAGQSLLILLGDRTRASGTYVVRDGVALLAPDSETYLEIATSFGEILTVPWTRWSYPALLAAVDAIGLPLSAVIAIQSLMFVFAGALLHALAEDATSSLLAGIAASATLLVNPLTAQWVRFVLTESLFMSMVVFAVWSMTRLRRRPSTALGVVASVSALTLTMMRPNGVLVLGATTAAIVAARGAEATAVRRRARLVAVWAGAAVALAAAAATTGQPGEASFASQLYRGVVIEGTDDVRMTIEMPPAPDPSDESTAAALGFGSEHPIAVGRLVITRIVVEVAQVRPHYPRAVNVAIGAAMLLLLAALALGVTDRRSRALLSPCLTVALPILLLVGLTFAVPEGRYGWGGLVALAPLAGVGVDRMLPRRLTRRFTSSSRAAA